MNCITRTFGAGLAAALACIAHTSYAQSPASSPASQAQARAIAPLSPASHPIGALWQGTVDGKTTVALTVFKEPADATRAASNSIPELRDQISGTVRYGSVLTPTSLRLDGRVASDGRFEWREWEVGTDDKGQPIRRESGRFTGVLNVDAKSGSGQWIGADGARRAPLLLTQAAQYRELVVQRGGATLTERFPVTGDAAVDALVQTLRLPACSERDIECRNGIEIAWLDAERISLLRTFWFFSGGAHGNSSYIGGNWRKTPQGYERTALADVLDATPACRDKLNQRLIEGLRRQGAAQADAGALDDKAFRSHTLPFVWHRKGIVLYYPPYAVGPYVQGSFRVSVGFSQLGACQRTGASRQG